jgi:hypothetical protein
MALTSVSLSLSLYRNCHFARSHERKTTIATHEEEPQTNEENKERRATTTITNNGSVTHRKSRKANRPKAGRATMQQQQTTGFPLLELH